MLTAREILQTEFRRSLRGYNEKDVDAFVRRVVKAYETLGKENKELAEKISVLEETQQSKNAALEHVQEQDARAIEERNKRLEAVERYASELETEAEKEAKKLVAQAQKEAKEILAAARESELAVEERIEDLKAEEARLRTALRNLLQSGLELLETTDSREDNKPVTYMSDVAPTRVQDAGVDYVMGEQEAAAALDTEVP